MYLYKIITEHPIVIFLFFYILFTAIQWLLIKNKNTDVLLKYLIKFSIFFSFLSILNYFLFIILYILYENFCDHVEPVVASLSWLFQTGKPVYNSAGSGELYSLVYGPVLYIINGFFLTILGPSIISAKAGGIIAALISAVINYMTLKKISNHRTAFIISGYITAGYLIFGHCSFWNRSDSFIICFVSLTIYAISKGNALYAMIIMSLSLGLSVNMKIHSFLYFIPLLILFHETFKTKVTVCSLAISAITASLPYVICSNINFFDYTSWLQEGTKTEFSKIVFLKNMEFIFLFFIPVIIYEKNKKYSLSLLISILFTSIIGSSTGAGRYHLLPFIPVLAYFFTLILNDLKEKISLKIISASMLTIMLMYIFTPYSSINYMGNNKFKRTIQKDLIGIMNSYPGKTIHMGYGDINNYPLTYVRPLLIYRGNPCMIEGPALFGRTIPEQILNKLKSGHINIWLIPRGSEPFEIRNWYDNKPLFNEEFKKIFYSHYECKNQTEYFSIWIKK
ncbi:MAG: glycosyltransferase family 39 protein [Candidatus Eremiobacterota bacterium]